VKVFSSAAQLPLAALHPSSGCWSSVSQSLGDVFYPLVPSLLFPCCYSGVLAPEISNSDFVVVSHRKLKTPSVRLTGFSPPLLAACLQLQIHAQGPAALSSSQSLP